MSFYFYFRFQRLKLGLAFFWHYKCWLRLSDYPALWKSLSMVALNTVNGGSTYILPPIADIWAYALSAPRSIGNALRELNTTLYNILQWLLARLITTPFSHSRMWEAVSSIRTLAGCDGAKTKYLTEATIDISRVAEGNKNFRWQPQQEHLGFVVKAPGQGICNTLGVLNDVLKRLLGL